MACWLFGTKPSNAQFLSIWHLQWYFLDKNILENVYKIMVISFGPPGAPYGAEGLIFQVKPRLIWCKYFLWGNDLLKFQNISGNLLHKSVKWINSLWPNDTIWRHRSGSTLAQIMAWCLTAPSHYLNQCWLIISKVLWHSSEGIIMRRSEDTNQ